MSFFEATPQSLQNYDRLTAAWNRIDVLTTALGLDHIDTDNPSAFVIERSAQSGTYLDSLYSLYAATAIPNESSPPTPIDYNKNPCQANGTVDPPSPGHSTDSPSPQGSLSPLSSNSDHIETSACSCQRTALMTNGWGDGATRLSTSSLWSPGWLEDWSPEEIEKEEGRRVFWTTYAIPLSLGMRNTYCITWLQDYRLSDMASLIKPLTIPRARGSTLSIYLVYVSAWAMTPCSIEMLYILTNLQDCRLFSWRGSPFRSWATTLSKNNRLGFKCPRAPPLGSSNSA